MKNLVRLLAVIALIIGSFWGKVPAQALNLTSIAFPSLPVAVLNAADAKLTTEFGAKIDLNNSDIRDFRDLRGFYPNLAGKIIKNAPYQEVEDVLNIPGLSATQKERLQANLEKFTVTEPSKEFIEGDDRFNPGVY
ncbi:MULTISPECIES: photosystem II complex extrinsic protein PsbU [unclassified Microcystis]|jgi:photosystem II PsbU protein|uniref:Photosystem II extrinsic protein U n=1 Tax=Microcystis aeruginosa Ma_QC_Ca_00000000_S207 TaxID=2486251 RepID=A0A552FY76_MICAE|nr:MULTISPECIES: photosystem II complex extrinsic protein PsbU [unclassified Microcystis]MCA2925970.1 photosystem II complex extrinsic protein PsbU [Microcystis sp. M020S1]MCA2935215.1 photosystem II complex extrinsic protein PsbU [Microcystis sp. M015S1]TRU51653.1 MAG: photosystem II complex extrinsic protein PsbU [Microcystis aeruginosa Ma_QC_Ca_00000000_S207]MCA2618308.1 photosystem II complex extrinsic protein PsbU [Microcystis sp. M099S2]MCA2651824.1 photosystem II complex extrinsic prote